MVARQDSTMDAYTMARGIDRPSSVLGVKLPNVRCPACSV